jgi:hypothetical protein
MQRKVSVHDFREANKELVLQLVLQRNLSPDSWRVCDEYELRGNKIVARFDEEHVQKWTSYEPLVDTPDLFLKFARLCEAPNFAVAARQFSRRYGLLHEPWQRQEDLSSFYRRAKRAWIVLRLYEAVLNADARAVESLVSTIVDENSGLTDAFRDAFRVYEVLCPKLSEEGRWLTVAMSMVTVLVGIEVQELCYPALDFEDPTLPLDYSKIRSTIGFENLIGAMYLQMHLLLASGGNLTRCEYCKGLISLTRSHPEGRKRRRDKKFCDNACRQAHHRSKKKRTQDAPS